MAISARTRLGDWPIWALKVKAARSARTPRPGGITNALITLDAVVLAQVDLTLSGARGATRPTVGHGSNILAGAEDGAGGGAVGAVADFYGKTDQVVVAGLHVREDEAFDDPDFGAEKGVMCFDAVFVEAADG